MIRNNFFALNINTQQVVLYDGVYYESSYKYWSKTNTLSYLFEISTFGISETQCVKRLYFRSVRVKKTFIDNTLKIKLLFEELKDKTNSCFLPFPYELIIKNVKINHKIKYV